MSYGRAKNFGPEGCQVPVGSGKCGETKTLSILNEFKNLYEKRLEQLDLEAEAGGDCLKAKINLQQQWIKDLMEQNEMMARTVEQLEIEATEKVKMLEEKLEKSAQCICEVMNRYRDYGHTLNLDEPFQKMFYVENDTKNLLEFIRRIREESWWSIDGLQFYDITYKDLFGDRKSCTKDDCPAQVNRDDNIKAEKKDTCLASKDKKIDDLSKDTSKLSKKLQEKESEFEDLRRSMLDMRKALAEEVASKHDMICALKRDIQHLEEQCMQADKQTAFKEDIIKELRKEIKQLKQQSSFSLEESNSSLQSALSSSSEENEKLKSKIEDEKKEIARLEKQFKEFLAEKEELKQKLKDARANADSANEHFQKNEIVCKKGQKEIDRLKAELSKLEKELQLTKADKKDLQSQINDLEKEVSSLKKEKKKFQSEIEDLESEVSKLKRKNKEVQDSKEKITSLNDSIEKLNNKIGDLTSELDKCKEQRVFDPSKLIDEEEEERPLDLLDTGYHERVTPEAFQDLDDLDPKQCIRKKDEIIKIQAHTLKILQLELQELKCKSVQSDAEKEQKSIQVADLDDKTDSLHAQLIDCQGRANNLQKAVDLYVNSINVLEAAEAKAKLEIEQQRITIANLQEALIAAKREIEELKQNSKQERVQQQYLLDVLYINLLDLEDKRKELLGQISEISNSYKCLLNTSFNLELEYIESLQDISVSEVRLIKYHDILKNCEDDKTDSKKEIRRLKLQKKSYEEVIHYFQYEVRVMADQLMNLQDILNMSNESSLAETAQLVDAIENLKEANQNLCGQLCGSEQRFQLENQMNQINERQIADLQEALNQKDMELSHYECAIEDMKGTLEDTLKMNQQLEDDICCLNCKVLHLEDQVKMYEDDNMHHLENNQACQTQIDVCEKNLAELKQLLEKKNEALEVLKNDYNIQYDSLVSTQGELQQLKDSQDERQKMIDQLKNTLCECKRKNNKLSTDTDSLRHKLKELGKAEATKDKELKHYQQIIHDLKQTLIDLNKDLSGADNNKQICQSDCKHVSTEPNISGRITPSSGIPGDIFELVSGLKKQLNERNDHIKGLQSECDKNKCQLAEFSTKDKDYQEVCQQLAKSQDEEKRLKNEFRNLENELAAMRDEIRKKDEQLNIFRENLQHIKEGRQLQETSLQEENNALRNEINTLIRKQVQLNHETEELQVQLSRAQKKVSDLEEKNLLMKEQLEQYLLEIEGLQNDKDILDQKNDQLTSDIEALQQALGCLKKQNRYNTDVIKTLEQELLDTKHSRDAITCESKHVIDNVRLWLEEQKAINEQVSEKMKCYAKDVETLQYEKQLLSHQVQNFMQHQSCAAPPMPIQGCLPSSTIYHSAVNQGGPSSILSSKRSRSTQRNSRHHSGRNEYPYNSNRPSKHCSIRTDHSERSISPWSLGSQGAASILDPRESPPGSSCGRCSSIQDWYSPTYKDIDETDDDFEEDNWVSKVDNLTAQFKKANKTWKNKMRNAEYCVSKDDKC